MDRALCSTSHHPNDGRSPAEFTHLCIHPSKLYCPLWNCTSGAFFLTELLKFRYSYAQLLTAPAFWNAVSRLNSKKHVPSPEHCRLMSRPGIWKQMPRGEQSEVNVKAECCEALVKAEHTVSCQGLSSLACVNCNRLRLLSPGLALQECHCMLFLTPDNDFAGREQNITIDEIMQSAGA